MLWLIEVKTYFKLTILTNYNDLTYFNNNYNFIIIENKNK